MPLSLLRRLRPTAPASGEVLRRRFADRLFADVVRALYRYEGNAVIGHVAAALLVCWFTRAELSAHQLGGLLTAVFGCATLRLILALRFRRQTGPPHAFDLRLHNAAIMCCAAAWSLNFLAVFADLSPARRAFMMMVLAGLTAGSLVTLSARVRSFALFSCTLLLPPVAVLIGARGAMDVDLGVMGLIFLGFCLAGARTASRLQQDMLLKRYQNQEIMADLARTKHELELAYERSESANRAKQRFLANISHEVRTPLNGVLGITEMLIESGLRPEQQEQADIVRRCGSNLMILVNDLLDLSKLELGRVQLERAPFDLHALLRETAQRHEPVAAQRRLGLRLTIAPGLPARITGDAARLRQVLDHLIGNAIKFSDEGEVRVSADLGVSAGAARLQIEIADDGIGIARDRHAAIFAPFAQADESDARAHGGAGLGLAITRHILERMGGSIHLESEPGVGSTFRFEVPLDPRDLQAEPGASGAAPAPTPAADVRDPAPARGRGILLAEDQPVNALVVQRLLTRLGFQVTHARDGQEAIEQFDARHHVAVILDLQMPRVDGWTAARALRALPNGDALPILALSAQCDATVAEQCRAAGMNDALQKPCSLNALREALAAFPGLLPAAPSAAAPPLQSVRADGR